MELLNFVNFSSSTIKGIIEILSMLLMIFGLAIIFWHRAKQGLGISSISLQFTVIIFVFPTILILSLEKVLQGETAGTLIGTLAGYIFSEFGKNRNQNTNNLTPSTPTKQ